MSSRREDDSRRAGTVASQRNTARDVPAAKFKEASVGTVAPRGLRGPSLLPGQGAPERIVPEEVELAVLRDAETLDGPRVARAVAKRLPDSRQPLLSPVSVEIPRVRSVPPGMHDYPSTPPSPSARSIQSGTLMSIGSVDPRAPTELSLPSPRPLSVSERAAYLGPEAVVDRAPAPAPARAPLGAVESERYSATERPTDRSATPNVSPRSERVSPSSNVGHSPTPDSVAPPGQHFARSPGSFAPPSPSTRPGLRPQLTSRHAPAPRSEPPESRAAAEVPPRFQIHSELAAVRQELQDDAFDLRSASTVREPLASRKVQESYDWIPNLRVADPQGRAFAPSHRPSSSSRTVARSESIAPLASPARSVAERAPRKLQWFVGAALFALLLALLVAWGLGAWGRSDEATPPGARTRLAPTSTISNPAEPAPAAEGRRSELPLGSARALPNAAQRAAPPKSTASAAPHASAGSNEPAPAHPDSSAKVHQSIY